MACEIKINGVKVQGPNLQAILQAAANNPVLRDALMYDNYIRLTKDEQVVDAQSINYLRKTFNVPKQKDVRNAIEREHARREALGLNKPSNRVIVGGGVKQKFAKVWAGTKDAFSNKGVWAFFGKYGRAMNETRIVRDGTMQRVLSDAKRNADILNGLLVTLDKYLTPEDRIAITNVLQNGGSKADMDKAFKTIPFTKLINDKVKRDLVIAKLQPAIKNMRESIDEGTKMLKSIPNLLTPLQIQTLTDNEGKYTTIIYEAHRNPDFRELYEYDSNGKMKGGPEYEAIFTAAVAPLKKFIGYKKAKLIKQRAKKAKAMATLTAKPNKTAFEDTQIEKLGKQITFLDSEILRLDDVINTPSSLHLEVLNILQDMEKNQNLTNIITAGGKRGAISKQIFKKRKDIPAEIKALFGEIKDPIDAYMSTIAKIVATAANADYQNSMADMNEIMVRDYTNALANNSTDFVPPFFSTVALPEAGLTRRIKLPDSFSVLAQRLETDVIYTTEELADFFQDNSFGTMASDFQGAFAAINSLAKINATVLSFPTQERNFISNLIKLASEIAISPQRGTIIKQLIKASARRLENEARGFSPQASQKHLTPVQKRIYNAAIEQGIKNSDVIYRGINRKLKGGDKIVGLIDAFMDNTGGKLSQKVTNIVKHVGKQTVGIPFRAYAAGDDVFKEALFAAELEKFSDAYYGKSYSDLIQTGTPAELRKVENEAGYVIRNTNTNYNEAWKITKLINDSGLGIMVAPFAIFRFEQFRVLGETTRLIAREIRNNDPDPEVRRKIRKIGWWRLASSSALGLASSSILINMFNGLDDDEEEYVRKNLVNDYTESPYISKNSNGDIEIVDMSSINVFGIIGLGDRFLQDLFSGDEELRNNSFSMLFDKLIEPIISTQIGAGSVVGAIRGEDSWGKELSDPQTTSGQQLWDRIAYTLKQIIMPGTIKAYQKITDKKVEAENKFENLNRPNREGVTKELEDLEWNDFLQAEDEVGREKIAFAPGVRVYAINPNINLPPKFYDMRERLMSNSTSYKSRVDKIQKDENRQVTDADRDKVYNELKEVYNKELDKLREYVEESQRFGYDPMNVIKLGIIKKGETASENTKEGSGLSKKVLAYISGETDEKPDLIIELYDTFRNIKRDKNGNVIE
jgi:hypothetical protein